MAKSDRARSVQRESELGTEHRAAARTIDLAAYGSFKHLYEYYNYRQVTLSSGTMSLDISLANGELESLLSLDCPSPPVAAR